MAAADPQTRDAPADGPARVARAAARLGLEIAPQRMPASTRTAEEAAAACGCPVGAIVKSLVFEADDGGLRLLLVAGDRKADLDAVAAETGERLRRADPKRVRAETGFAIGGVPPLGHETPAPVLMDAALMANPVVWAAAGAPDAVFAVAPRALADAVEARVLAIGAA